VDGQRFNGEESVLIVIIIYSTRRERKLANPMTEYKEGDKAYVFMTSGSFTKRMKIKTKDIMFLAKVTVKSSDFYSYYVHIDEIILNVPSNLFLKNQVSRFAHLWIDRGEEAFKIWYNPSHR
jgi:hypothetical protein